MGDNIKSPIIQLFTGDGDPGVGYKLYSYEPGTTTGKLLYSDRACTTPHTNPVVADARGEVEVYGLGVYKLVAKTDADVTLWTVDNVAGLGGGFEFTTISDHSNNLTTAVAAIGATETTLHINAATTVDGAVVVPSTLRLVFTEQGYITHSANTLTINSDIVAGGWQIFSGTGVVTLGKRYAMVDWFASTVDRAAFVRACASVGAWTGGTVGLSRKTYNIDTTAGTIPFKCSIVCEDGLATIVNADETNYAFTALRDESSAVVYAQSVKLRGFYLQSKFGVSFNSDESGIASGSGEGEILGASVDGCQFLGTYDSGEDANYATATAVTLSTLKAFGVGLRISKCFNLNISNNIFTGYGIGIYSIGSDICSIYNNRLQQCARWMHLLYSGTYGSQTRIEHNDLLGCCRVGGLWIDQQYTTIDDNFFENSEAQKLSGRFIETDDDYGTLIINNRFNGTNSASPPMLKLVPNYGMRVENNRYNPGATASTLDLDCSTNWTGSNQQLRGPMVVLKDNMPEFPDPTAEPWVQKGPVDSLLFNFQNAVRISGTGPATQFPWYYNAVTEVHELQQDTNTTIAYFDLQQTAAAYKVKLKGMRLTDNGYLVISHQYDYDGAATALYSGYAYFKNTSEYEEKAITVQIPGGAGPSTLTVNLYTDVVAYVSIEVEPVIQFGPYHDVAVYDFSVHGGAVSTIDLAPFPDNATITKAYYEVITAPTSSGSATIGLGVSGDDASGLVAGATAFDNAAYGAGYHDTAADGTATNFTTKTTANRTIIIVIGAAALTAGKIAVHYEWVVSE